MYIVAASRPRCLVVASGLTAALWGAAAVLVRAMGDPPAEPGASDRGLTRLCLAALVVAAAWAWAQGIAAVAEAWRGTRRTPPRGLRRLVLAACGVALAGSLAAPAHAAPDRPRPEPLSGLPLPERAQGPARPAEHRVVVRPGDSLWALAERDLGGATSDQRVDDRWQAIYHRNRGVIGPDPDLIHPGQVLEIPQEQS
ncbi:MAG TPA: LysM peptidoglycan-binding domain-containing protein [Nocardioides sp.]|uniref:LysM peptidoglycan-binding domain-containing protein n=1 Tax=Nocardioides sp. TaxID=35761 RepID=UPI002E31972D|nr:LysM peptidoglycan-binding domain-containing protein [Nocardioides sp.]HEX5088059.1 LysM peptidoglycan-binding domain-containing protein [Nocardioides sp.]